MHNEARIQHNYNIHVERWSKTQLTITRAIKKNIREMCDVLFLYVKKNNERNEQMLCDQGFV